MNDAGKVAFTPRGVFDSAVTYEYLDTVQFGGNCYAARKTTTGNVPPTTGSYVDDNWAVLVIGGASVPIATIDVAGLVKSGNDIGVDKTGEMILKTDFTEQTDLAVLTGNEDRQTFFGKIAKAVSSLISHISLSATADKAGHVKLSNSSAVTDSTGLALPATEKNAALDGTMANQIATLSKSLTPKQAVAVCLKTAAQDIVSNQSYKVPLDTVTGDTGMCSISGNAVTIKESGLYAILGKAHIAINAKDTAQYSLYVNGECYCTSTCSNQENAADQYHISGCVPAIWLDAGSTIYMTAKEIIGGAGFLYGAGASSKIAVTRLHV